MKLKVQHVFEASPVIQAIANENRPMPQVGKFRLARMLSKLWPEHQVVVARRDAMIMAYDHRAQRVDDNGALLFNPDGSPLIADQSSVPPDKAQEFLAAWAEIGAEEIEVAVEPIPLSCLDMGDNADGSIAAYELVLLGDLVTE